MSERILVVDDEKALLESLVYNLERQGYLVDSAADGHTALESARKNHPDLILLDIMLPGMDGFEVARTLRQESNIPILMLTARDDEIDRVVGLEVGADDYMTKPFSMRELLARVKAMLRRVRLIREEMSVKPQDSTPDAPPLVFGNLEMDTIRHMVKLEGAELELNPKEYELLKYFMQHPGKAISRDTLIQEIWGWDFSGDSRTVDVHVRWLRQKIEQDPSNPTRLVTLRGAGYRFES
ncbi:MAG TPA: DNA-binding response regulator [Anaerolineaceae bacterium]|jgi:DNA-binding response OmpR family regulator|nr:DNA-binding response regulator [Anaerolineaceae bacterium]